MKAIRDLLRQVLATEGEMRSIVIVYQLKGKKPQAVHNFERQAAAIAFVTGTLRLSDDEWLDILRHRA